MNETFKHCVNSVFELYIYLLISRRYPITPFPPPYPWKIIVNCDEEGVLKTQIGKFQPNQGLGGWRALKKKARGAIELQCSVTGKKLAGYNRFDHIHIECKQKLLVEIFGN